MKRSTYKTYALRMILSLCLIATFAIQGANAQKADKVEDQQPSSSSNDLDEVPDEYIEEAWNFNQYCRGEPKISRYQNCECLASLYLDRRIEVGPKVRSSSILLAIEGKCPDATDEAGHVYTECLGDGPIMPAETPLKEFCKCYATTYTKLFEVTRAKPSSRTFVRLKTQAMTMCRNPDLARRIYPGAVGLSR